MVRQEFRMSCGAACARQLLLDAGVEVTESVVRQRAGFDEANPIWAPDLARALTELHRGATYEAKSITPATLGPLLAHGAFIALLKTPSGKHYVIVNDGGYDTSHGVVRIRDPAGTSEGAAMGAEGVMDLEKFHELWRRAFNYAVYRSA